MEKICLFFTWLSGWLEIRTVDSFLVVFTDVFSFQQHRLSKKQKRKKKQQKVVQVRNAFLLFSVVVLVLMFFKTPVK